MEFVSLQGANTASLTFDHVKLDPNWVLSKEGTDYIAKTRPNFLGFQFGLAFGLAKRSLNEVEASLNSNRSVLREESETTRNNLLAIQDQLFAGLNDDDYFIDKPRELFQLRIDIVDVVANSLLLEQMCIRDRAESCARACLADHSKSLRRTFTVNMVLRSAY